MLLSFLLIIPIIGTITVASLTTFVKNSVLYIKQIGLIFSVLTLLLSLFIFVFFDLNLFFLLNTTKLKMLFCARSIELTN